MKAKMLLLAIVTTCALGVTAQTGAMKNAVFQTGEVVNYDVYYNWGLIWMHAGKADFSVQEMMYKKTSAYHLKATGSSLKTFDSFFRVRDTLTSIVDKNTLLPLYAKRVAHEDKYWAQDEFHFTGAGAQTTIIGEHRRKNNQYKKNTLTYQGTVTDMVTAFYRIRNLDIANMKENSTYSFSIVFDDDQKPFNLNFRYLGKEEIKLRNGKRYRCLKLRPLLMEGNVFKDKQGMTVWISDDENRIPVLIESSIRVGSVKVMLAGTKNLLYPLNAEIKKK